MFMQGVMRQITINDMPIGRNVDESLRLVHALQFHAEHGEVREGLVRPGNYFCLTATL